MRVFQIEGDWGFEHLHEAQRPKPEPGPEQVLVAMRAAPLIPVSDGVGEVVAVGKKVDRVKVGDRVCPSYFQNWVGGEPTRASFASALGGPLDGVMAEFVCLSQQGVVHVPDYLSDAEAATLPCAALTAWSAIATYGKANKGDKILVQGTGGVALFALAFAKLHGAHVTVISSSNEKLERVREMGADETINYVDTEDWAKVCRSITEERGGFDNIIELGGTKTLPLSLRAVKPGGTISLIGVLSGLNMDASLGAIVTRQVRLQGITVGHRDGLEAMMTAMDKHKIKPVLGESFAFDQLKPALDHLRKSGHFGKTTLQF